jgi:DNA-binding transcriptional ArsR family regulator
MTEFDRLPASLGPRLFLRAYDMILWQRPPQIPVAKALKCMGLFNAICWRNARSETVTMGHLSEIFGVTKPGIQRHLQYLRDLGLLIVEVEGEVIGKTHILKSPANICEYLQSALAVAGEPDENECYANSDDVTIAINNAVRRILVERGEHEPSFALQTVGFFLVIVGMCAQGEPVTRKTLADRLGPTGNALRGRINYLVRIDLVTLVDAPRKRGFRKVVHIHVCQHLADAVRQAMEGSDMVG